VRAERGAESGLAVGRGRSGGRDARDLAWEFLGETEIGEDDMAIGANKDVLGLEVAVDDARCM
jgi:hypothetical protein